MNTLQLLDGLKNGTITINSKYHKHINIIENIERYINRKQERIKQAKDEGKEDVKFYESDLTDNIEIGSAIIEPFNEIGLEVCSDVKLDISEKEEGEIIYNYIKDEKNKTYIK